MVAKLIKSKSVLRKEKLFLLINLVFKTINKINQKQISFLIQLLNKKIKIFKVIKFFKTNLKILLQKLLKKEKKFLQTNN